MIETRRLKNIVIFFQTIISFVLSRKIIENGYDKSYPSSSTPARIYGTPKMRKFSSSDSLPKFRPIVSSISTFNYNLARLLCDLCSPLVPNDYSCKDFSNEECKSFQNIPCFLRCN